MTIQARKEVVEDIPNSGGDVVWSDTYDIRKSPDCDSETRMFYEYDTMKSPFQGFIGYIGRDMHYGEWGSRNNSVMDSISTPFVDMQECVHFTYEYVDGYPVKRTHIIPNDGMDGKMEVRYEYEE